MRVGGWGGGRGAREAAVEGGRWCPSQPRLEKAAVRQQAHLAATQDENRGGIQKAGAAEPMRWVFARA